MQPVSVGPPAGPIRLTKTSRAQWIRPRPPLSDERRRSGPDGTSPRRALDYHRSALPFPGQRDGPMSPSPCPPCVGHVALTQRRQTAHPVRSLTPGGKHPTSLDLSRYFFVRLCGSTHPGVSRPLPVKRTLSWWAIIQGNLAASCDVTHFGVRVLATGNKKRR